jgi:hypothetical protein
VNVRTFQLIVRSIDRSAAAAAAATRKKKKKKMVKFSREYEASIIPEWKAAFVDYKRLKKLIKRIKVTRRDDSFAAANAAAAADHLLPPPPAEKEAGGYGFSILDPVRAIAARFSAGQQPSASVRRRCVSNQILTNKRVLIN